jgi:hypothetical protein
MQTRDNDHAAMTSKRSLPLAVAVVSLAFAAPAVAFEIQGVHHSIALPLSGEASQTCPAGTHIVSGGAASRNGRIFRSVKHGNGWMAGADPVGPGARLTVYAYCSRKDLSLITTRAEKTASSSILLSATCPTDTFPVSSGGSITNGALNGFVPSNGGWFVDGVASEASATLVARAYCTASHIHLDSHHSAQEHGVQSESVSCDPSEFPVAPGGLLSEGFLSAIRLTHAGAIVKSTVADDTMLADVECF